VEQIKAAMMSICFKEKIKIKPEALSELIIGCVYRTLSYVMDLAFDGMSGYSSRPK
jgi:hypothetical protein